MKVSASGPPDVPGGARGRSTTAVIPWLLAGCYVAAHLPFLSPTLEDIDSLNFALGLREFDPGLHQPHPPGYPVYIALGRVALAAAHAVAPQAGRLALEAWALSIWSAVGGAAAIVCGYRVFSLLASWDARVGESPRARETAVWATALLACSPLFWMTGLRPMSDMAGLGVALAAQALLLTAARAPGPTSAAALMAGAFVAGLGLGVRSQMFWLTLPLGVYALARQPAEDRARLAVRAGAAGVAGVVLWALPLLAASGGVSAYLAALGAQAGEDIAHVEMLLADPTPRQLAIALHRTVILPWASTALAVVVLSAAAVGGTVMFLRERSALVALCIAFGPYLAFHLLYQETVTVRYALPFMPALAFTAMRGVAVVGRPRRALALPIALAALLIAVPGGRAYGSNPHPAFRAIEDMERRAESEPPAFVTSHFTFARSIRAADPQGLLVRLSRGAGWRHLVEDWASGGTGPVWFLADPKRTDLELIDKAQRRDRVRYRWAVEGRPELSGTRPTNVDWYRIRPPRWFLGEGWSLTPELGGVVASEGSGPDRAPIVGYVRRSAEPARLMIGGRYLAEADGGAVAFELALDGEVVDRWTLTFAQRNFLRFLDLPRGVPSGADGYARLTVVARAETGEGSRVPVAVRQFDLQPASALIWGYGPGWHEEEYVFLTGARWRWTSERSVVRVRGHAGPIRLTLRGESPLRYFDTAPTVTITAAGRVVASLQPAADFTWSVVVPAADATAATGDIVIETSRVFSPVERGGSSDARRLGLRIYGVDLQPGH